MGIPFVVDFEHVLRYGWILLRSIEDCRICRVRFGKKP